MWQTLPFHLTLLTWMLVYFVDFLLKIKKKPTKQHNFPGKPVKYPSVIPLPVSHCAQSPRCPRHTSAATWPGSGRSWRAPTRGSGGRWRGSCTGPGPTSPWRAARSWRASPRPSPGTVEGVCPVSNVRSSSGCCFYFLLNGPFFGPRLSNNYTWFICMLDRLLNGSDHQKCELLMMLIGGSSHIVSAKLIIFLKVNKCF